MRLSAKEDIGQPQTTVWQAVTDFDGFERRALRRGVQMRRLDGEAPVGVGARWRMVFTYRGRERDLVAEISKFVEPTDLVFDGHVAGLEVNFVLELLALGSARTRMSCSLELTPRTLTARVLVQSMKLTRGTFERRFAKRVADFAKELETR